MQPSAATVQMTIFAKYSSELSAAQHVSLIRVNINMGYGQELVL